MSDTRWRQVVRGYQTGTDGQVVPARAGAQTLARMAIAAGLTPGNLEDAGRPDAAEQQRRIMNQMTHDSVVPLPVNATGDQPDVIDMIYASQTMPTREKLLRIQQVIQLRRQAELEEQAARTQQEAPAEAGAEVREDLPG